LLNDFRKDYLLNRWVVIATHRRRRPTDFAKEEVTRRVDTHSCPFCPGNERKTPPAVLVYLKGEKGVVKEKDTDGLRHKDWLIRCVPNLYSAFSPPEKGESFKSGKAVGHHEVLIDRNHGLDAGASLSHAHSQIIAMPTMPAIPGDELRASKKFYEEHGTCVFCGILEKEKSGPRFIWENKSFVAFAPWAAVHPFEFWILPKKHQATLLDIELEAIEDLAGALKTCLGGLKSLLNDPPYNFGFHIAPSAEADKFYHWHLEVYPKLTIWAGFEKSTGMYINVVPPEDAAQNLKDAIESG